MNNSLHILLYPQDKQEIEHEGSPITAVVDVDNFNHHMYYSCTAVEFLREVMEYAINESLNISIEYNDDHSLVHVGGYGFHVKEYTVHEIT